MKALILTGLAAGAASAAMFASVVSGEPISMILFYLAPLPLMVAAVGWGAFCSSLGGIAAAIILGAIFGLPLCLGFVIIVALPAWWLGRLALLSRYSVSAALPAGTAVPAEPAIEWYPVGHILPWIAGFAALTMIAALLTLGTNADDINSALRSGFMRIFEAGDPQLSEEINQWIDALVAIAPAAATIISMLTLTFNLWLSAKITATSGRLCRPWPDLMSVQLPPMTLVALCIAIAFCFTGGLTAIVARIVTASLTMAYALAGFAVLHTLTLALKSRAFWLGSTYAIVFVLGWPLIAIVILGLADAMFGIRERFLRSRPPPLPSS